MTLVYDDGTRRRAYTKGAPEVVAALARGRRDLLEAAAHWATEGFRVLAVATPRPRSPMRTCDESVERGLELLGVVALHDPLRATTPAAVADARRAGIAVRMLTGDHPATAQTIGRAIGLPDDAIVARATPADKLALVRGAPGERRDRRGHRRRRQRRAGAPARRCRRRDGNVRHRSRARSVRDRPHRRRLRDHRRRGRRGTPDRRQHPQVRRVPALREFRRSARLRGRDRARGSACRSRSSRSCSSTSSPTACPPSRSPRIRPSRRR